MSPASLHLAQTWLCLSSTQLPPVRLGLQGACGAQGFALVGCGLEQLHGELGQPPPWVLLSHNTLPDSVAANTGWNVICATKVFPNALCTYLLQRQGRCLVP